MFEPDRNALRRQFFEAWKKRRAGAVLQPLEAQIAAIIELHPEYHALLENEDTLSRDFTPDDGQVNPFLHLSLHLAVREQVGTDRPAGIRHVIEALAKSLGDPHAAEHVALECLGEALWRAQRDGKPPDEEAYLRALRTELERARR